MGLPRRPAPPVSRPAPPGTFSRKTGEGGAPGYSRVETYRSIPAAGTPTRIGTHSSG
jgi:hypothetical protein